MVIAGWLKEIVKKGRPTIHTLGNIETATGAKPGDRAHSFTVRFEIPDDFHLNTYAKLHYPPEPYLEHYDIKKNITEKWIEFTFRANNARIGTLQAAHGYLKSIRDKVQEPETG